MVFYPRYGLILSNIQRNWFAISSDARRARKVLQFNFEECWTVLIHTSDKRPSHSHCYQVNDCQVTYIKNVLLLKGGQYFCTEKKYVSPFLTKNIFTSKRWTVFFFQYKNTVHLLLMKIFLVIKGGQYFLYWKKYVPPFTNKNILLLKGWQCLKKYVPPFITKMLLLQSFTW